MTTYAVVEKNNHLAVHALCHSMEAARRWIEVSAPTYCARGFFMDKTLTPESFEIIVKE